MICETRTFCYLDTNIEQVSGEGRPLLEILKLMVHDKSSLECYYRLVIVYEVCSCVTMWQFSHYVLWNQMRVLLSSFLPSEILLLLELKSLCETVCARV